MNVERSQVTKLTITGAHRLDPITAFLEDLGPNQGKMTVECWGRSWSAYWGGMGGTLTDFLRRVSVDYLAGCFARGPAINSSVYDPEKLEATLKREVLKERRAYLSSISKAKARAMWEEIEGMDFEHPYHIRSSLLAELLGDDWQCALPEKPNPDWVYLSSVIRAVKEAIALGPSHVGGGA
jgi:hypothetical protein